VVHKSNHVIHGMILMNVHKDVSFGGYRTIFTILVLMSREFCPSIIGGCSSVAKTWVNVLNGEPE